MRLILALAICASLVACKKHPQPTVSRMPDTNMMGRGNDDVEYPEGKLFHTIYRYPGHAGQVLAYYGPEMERRGASRAPGDIFTDGNIEHLGDIGRSGTARVKDPGKAGVWLAVFETNDFTLVDVWEAVPNPA
jgi:hypothetical protein